VGLPAIELVGGAVGIGLDAGVGNEVLVLVGAAVLIGGELLAGVQVTRDTCDGWATLGWVSCEIAVGVLVAAVFARAASSARTFAQAYAAEHDQCIRPQSPSVDHFSSRSLSPSFSAPSLASSSRSSSCHFCSGGLSVTCCVAIHVNQRRCSSAF
jgi:hypothetical protein